MMNQYGSNGRDQFFLLEGANPAHLDELMFMDSWSVETAAKVIALGFNVDLDALLEGGEHPDSIAIRSAVNRCYAIAQSSIKAGLLSEFDSPANWVRWAVRKGYDVTHLSPTLAIAQLREAAGKDEISDWARQNYERQIDELERVHAAMGEDAAAPAPAVNKGTPKALTDAQEAEIVRLYDRGRGVSVNKLSQQFGVSRPTVDSALRAAGVKR